MRNLTESDLDRLRIQLIKYVDSRFSTAEFQISERFQNVNDAIFKVGGEDVIDFLYTAVVQLSLNQDSMITTLDYVLPGYFDLYTAYAYKGQIDAQLEYTFDIQKLISDSLESFSTNILGTDAFSTLVKSSWRIVKVDVTFSAIDFILDDVNVDFKRFVLTEHRRTTEGATGTACIYQDELVQRIPDVVKRITTQVNPTTWDTSIAEPSIGNSVIVFSNGLLTRNGTLVAGYSSTPFRIPSSNPLVQITIGEISYPSILSGLTVNKRAVSGDNTRFDYDMFIDLGFDTYLPFISNLTNMTDDQIQVLPVLMCQTGTYFNTISYATFNFSEHMVGNLKRTSLALQFTVRETQISNIKFKIMLKNDIMLDNADIPTQEVFIWQHIGRDRIKPGVSIFTQGDNTHPGVSYEYAKNDETYLNFGAQFRWAYLQIGSYNSPPNPANARKVTFRYDNTRRRQAYGLQDQNCYPSYDYPGSTDGSEPYGFTNAERDAIIKNYSFLGFNNFGRNTAVPANLGDLSVLQVQALLPPLGINITDSVSVAQFIQNAYTVTKLATLEDMTNEIAKQVNNLGDYLDTIVTKLNAVTDAVVQISTELARFEKQTADNFDEIQAYFKEMSDAEDAKWGIVGQTAGIVAGISAPLLALPPPLNIIGIIGLGISSIMNVTVAARNLTIHASTSNIIATVGAALSVASDLMAIKSNIKSKLAAVKMDQTIAATMKVDMDKLVNISKNLGTTGKLSVPKVEIQGRNLNLDDVSLPKAVVNKIGTWMTNYNSKSNAYKKVTEYLVDIGIAPVHTNLKYTSEVTEYPLITAPVRRIIPKEYVAKYKGIPIDSDPSLEQTIVASKTVRVFDYKPGESLSDQRLNVLKGINNADNSLQVRSYVEYDYIDSTGKIKTGVDQGELSRLDAYYKDVADTSYISFKAGNSIRAPIQLEAILESLPNWGSYKLTGTLAEFSNCQTLSGIVYTWFTKAGQPARLPEAVATDYNTRILSKIVYKDMIKDYIPTFNMNDFDAAQYLKTKSLI